jgi:radical SAM superfamily enzyme YgiQ (UPF0313 family)
MARILLLSPPYLDLYGKLSKAAGRYFPLGLAYIASYLRKYGGHKVSMFEPEAQALTYDDIARVLRDTSPDVVGLTCSTPNFPRALELARIVKQHSGAKVVVGGVHATALPEFIMGRYADLIDSVVVGEGEETMLALVNAYESARGMDDIAGIAYMSGDSVRVNPCRPFIHDLDIIPFPARDLIPQHLFWPNLHNARYKRGATILTSRGCPFNCTFCAARLVSGKKYRTHSAEYVLSEMEMLKKDYGTEQLLITDDTFTINRRRLEEICRGMIRRKLNLKWFCFSQVNTVTEDTLKLMKEAGCYNIGFGVESASEEVLRKMGKNIKPERALETVRLANRLGFKTQAFYIFGTPGETREMMEETMRFAETVSSTLAFFNMLVPYPGTREFDFYFAETPLETIDWSDFVAVGEKSVLAKNPDVPPRELERLLARANVSYYFHPLRLMRLAFHIRTSHEFANYFMAGLGFLRQIVRWSGRGGGK